LSHDIPERALLADALSAKSGRKVEVSVPQRGEKRELVLHALTNAREALGRKLADTSSQQKLLRALADTFGLPREPRRIEVYDNSHIQGANAVGAMIVAGLEGFQKNQYRKFNIRSADLTPGDDFGMMREVLERRFKRLMAEAPRSATAGLQLPSPHSLSKTGVNALLSGEGGEPHSGEPGEGSAMVTSAHPSPALASLASPLPQGERGSEPAASLGDDNEAESPWPDLVLIDGGQGQLNAARAALAALGVTDVPLIGVAKGPDRDAGNETFYLPDRPAIKLPPRDPLLYFIQRLRDEAHRFAIGSHRARRKKDIREAGLQEIPGIGPTRKRALLRHFGTLKAIERASVADLAQVPGINDETARKIHDFFHEAAG
jgi:excinuclease ABC subunit C